MTTPAEQEEVVAHARRWMAAHGERDMPIAKKMNGAIVDIATDRDRLRAEVAQLADENAALRSGIDAEHEGKRSLDATIGLLEDENKALRGGADEYLRDCARRDRSRARQAEARANALAAENAKARELLGLCAWPDELRDQIAAFLKTGGGR